MTLSVRSLVAAAVLVGAAAAHAGAAPSTLDPAGVDAAVLADLLWWMALGAAVLWVAAMGFLLYCLYGPRVGESSPGPARVTTSRGVWHASVPTPRR